MKETRVMMGMPITVEIISQSRSGKRLPPGSARLAAQDMIAQVYDYFGHVDAVFSPYKSESEVSRFNRGELKLDQASAEFQTILELADQTKQETDGYFDVFLGKTLDPSGIVKGWAIREAAKLVTAAGYQDFYLEAGGDIQVSGRNTQGQNWRVGIRHPWQKDKVVKVLEIVDRGVATSGSYERGRHIYNPKLGQPVQAGVVSLTVIGPDVYEADRFATAAFAMGPAGVEFIEHLPGFEGYQINEQGQATMTTGFEQYVTEV